MKIEHDIVNRIEARRSSMLSDLLIEMERHHRRRRARRHATLVATPVIIVALLASLVVRTMSSSRASLRQPHTVTAKLAANHNSVSIIVRTDPGILARYAAAARPKVELIDDDALIASLAALNIHTGLARSEGKVWLTATLPAEMMNSPSEPGGT